MRRLTMMSAALAAVTFAAAPNVQAALTLNAVGIADGFSLSTFYSDPSVQYGLLGITTGANGKVIAAGYGYNQVLSFNDVDGQTYASASNIASAPGSATSTATVGGKTYVGILGGGYYQIDPTTLALTPLVLSTSLTHDYGLWGNSVTGHLIASTSSGLVDIDPATGTVKQVGPAGQFVDGVSVSSDGKTAYGEEFSSHIFGYDIATGVQVADYSLNHQPDGTGVITGTAFNGYVIANNNDGTVSLVNPTSGLETVIASGGTRGDLVGPDLTNGTLFLSEYDAEYRLGISGGSIGGPPAPEPATWALMLVGMGLLGGAMRRRAAKSATAIS